MHLQIRPGLVRAWRAPGRLQVGLDPRHGVVLDGLTAGDERVLHALDAGAYDLSTLTEQGARWGVPAVRVLGLVQALEKVGALLPSRTRVPVLAALDEAALQHLTGSAECLAVAYPQGDGWDAVARRLTSSVQVLGGCRTGLRIALALAAAGVGHVTVHDERRVLSHETGPEGYAVQDVGRQRGRAASDLLAERLVGPVRTRTRERNGPDVAVLLALACADPMRYDPLLRDDVAHLTVLLREGDAVVGPFVRPGLTCCLRCLDLYRTDRDQAWPRVAAQLGAGPPRRFDPALSDLAAALAVSEVLTVLDGYTQPVTTGATLEVRPGHTLPRLRHWPAHSRCGCRWLPSSTPVSARSGPPVTMDA